MLPKHRGEVSERPTESSTFGHSAFRVDANSLFKKREIDEELWNIDDVLQAEVILTSEERIGTFGLEGNAEHLVTKRHRVGGLQTFPAEEKESSGTHSPSRDDVRVPTASVSSHKFKGVWRRSDKEPSRFETLTSIPQHHVGLLLALK